MKPVKVKITSQQEANTLKGLLTFFDHPVDHLMFECYSPIMFLVKTREEKDWILVNQIHSILSECEEVTIEDFITSIVLPKKAESILDGKCAIQVSNEREFSLLMSHYESRGWKWNGGDKPNISVTLEYPCNIEYANLFYHSIDNLSNSYKIISFEDFASEIGIKVPVFILRSEDGVDLYEGDNYHRVYFKKVWEYDRCSDLKQHHAVNRKDEFASKAKAFSTREAAEDWISEMNKPKSILIAEESSYPVEVFNHEIVVKCKTSHKHLDNIIISASELESIYKAYQSLQES